MDTSLDRIRAKITELEDKLTNLRITERELLELEGAPARKAPAPPKSTVETAPEPATESDLEPVSTPHQTIVATITDCLGEHTGPCPCLPSPSTLRRQGGKSITGPYPLLCRP